MNVDLRGRGLRREPNVAAVICNKPPQYYRGLHLTPCSRAQEDAQLAIAKPGARQSIDWVTKGLTKMIKIKHFK